MAALPPDRGDVPEILSAVYASLSAVLIVWLSLNVIRVRRAKRISIGDQGDVQLRTAIAAQANAIEYIPIALILLVLLEYNDTHPLLVHAFGLSLLVGRVIHARAILGEDLQRRVLGMPITIWVLLGLAIANIVFLPFEKFT